MGGAKWIKKSVYYTSF